jgi:hypothetical protein
MNTFVGISSAFIFLVLFNYRFIFTSPMVNVQTIEINQHMKSELHQTQFTL